MYIHTFHVEVSDGRGFSTQSVPAVLSFIALVGGRHTVHVTHTTEWFEV